MLDGTLFALKQSKLCHLTFKTVLRLIIFGGISPDRASSMWAWTLHAHMGMPTCRCVPHVGMQRQEVEKSL